MENKQTNEKITWPWIIVGALYGLLLRISFDYIPSSIEGPMSIAFLIGTPFVVGAITIYGYRDSKPKIYQMIFYPWVTTLLMLLGTALALIEGSICIAIMTPLFLLCASFGGVAMGFAMYVVNKRKQSLLSISILPFLLFFTEGYIPISEQSIEIVESIEINASPDVIWEQIMTAKDISSEDLPRSLTHLIGVPKPVEGVNVIENNIEVRYSIWEKGVNFKAHVIQSDENAYIKWNYIFDENSFPKGSMDDHVAIGGEYFDLKDTAFELKPLENGNTQLSIIANYRVNSRIKFYAIPVSKILGKDFVRTILGLYKNRSEKA